MNDTNVFTQVLDLNSMEILFKTSEIFSQSGALSENADGAYSFTTINDFNGIGYYDFSSQKYTPLVDDKNGMIVNFQLMNAN